MSALLVVFATSGLDCPLGYDYGGAAGNDTDQDPLLFHPRFHLMPPTRKDRPTGMNDMNAVFYADGVYHVTYQDHVNCPDDVNQGNQSFGHVASRDLVHWVHLPSMLSDVPEFDGSHGPWDGPGFVCNGRPAVIYNSHFDGPSFGSQTKTAAFPSGGPADAWLANWSRAPLQPPEAFVGSSTLLPPWQGADGAYYTAAQDEKSHGCWLWRSTNCTAWEVVSETFGFCASNSPEIYPTPPPCAGCPSTPPPPNQSFVAKQTQWGGRDIYRFGQLSGVGAAQQWVPAQNGWQFFEVGKRSEFEDGRSAWSESLWDPVGKRRIMIGWVPPGVSA